MSESTWHSVRPWAPSLSLSVREITSVSATFILSSTVADNETSIDLDSEPDEPDDPADLVSQSTAPRKSPSFIADALAKGLSVNVNGSAWPRAFIRIDDRLDEAVIIIYALMPGRQYDIELALASVGRSGVLTSHLVTDDDSDNDTSEILTDAESASPDHSTSSDPHSTPSTSPSRTAPGTPPASTSSAASTATPGTVEQDTIGDTLAQLRQALAQGNAERESLLTSLKTARRDAQKADSALRSEIDSLKRASEKNSAAELRGKQKVLALQEAVKRTQNSTKETEEQVKEVEDELPEVEREREEREKEYARLKEEAERVHKQRLAVEEEERKKVDSMHSELASLTHKVERLGGKSEKLEKTTIPDLEDRLFDLQKEIEAEEQHVAALEKEEALRMSYFGYNDFRPHHPQVPAPVPEGSILDPHRDVPIPRPRYQSGEKPPPPIARPNPGPISRPRAQSQNQPSTQGATAQTNGFGSATNSPALPRGLPSHQYSLPSYGHNPRSQSFHLNHQQTTPVILTNPQRRGSLISTSSSNSSSPSLSGTAANGTSFSSSPSTMTNGSTAHSSSPTRANGIALTSTLSSRAAPFEPSRMIKNGLASSGSFGGTPTSSSTSANHVSPIQRPGVRASVSGGDLGGGSSGATTRRSLSGKRGTIPAWSSQGHGAHS